VQQSRAYSIKQHRPLISPSHTSLAIYSQRCTPPLMLILFQYRSSSAFIHIALLHPFSLHHVFCIFASGILQFLLDMLFIHPLLPQQNGMYLLLQSLPPSLSLPYNFDNLLWNHFFPFRSTFVVRYDFFLSKL
jgi:hypothetical protein